MMIQVHPQFVVDEFEQKKAVLLSLQEWQAVMEALEEFDDIQAYDQIKMQNQDSIPFEQAVKEIEVGYES